MFIFPKDSQLDLDARNQFVQVTLCWKSPASPAFGVQQLPFEAENPSEKDTLYMCTFSR
jgi:hypothetical protein